MGQLARFLLIAIFSSAVTAAAIYYYLAPAPAPHTLIASPVPSVDPKSSATAGSASQQQQLLRLLEEREQTIISLEQEIAWLQSIIEQIGTSGDTTADKHNRQANTQQLWFDEASLLKAGFNKQDVTNLKERVEAHALDMLDLRNRGMREGWGRGGKLFKEIRELEQQFQASFTPQEYDAVLYATGRNNRVEVTDTLGNSAAAYGGIRAGDVILSYDGEKILEPSALNRLTAQGDIGEMVSLRIQRGEDIVTVYVPRGTLGIRLKMTRAKPEPY